MKKLAIASVAAGVLAIAAVSSAVAGMSMQGPRLTGVALQSIASDKPAIVEATLPSDNAINPRKANGSPSAGCR